MIIVSLHCQMGNQMFQYAFAWSQSKRLRTIFIPFLSSPFYSYQLQFFKIDTFTNFIYSNNWRAHQFKRVCRKLQKYAFKETIKDDEWKPVIPDKNCVYYEGFFQADLYFKDYESEIRKSFRIKEKYKKEFSKKYARLFSNNRIIVVHCRRKDYNDVEFEGLGGQGVALPMSYYLNALNSIENIEQYKVLFIGDDMKSIRSDFGEKPNYYYETNPAIVDFQLIQHADIAIIANSTFAWWAGYLSPKKDSRIIAPEYWLGYKVKRIYPGGIHTNKFEWIDF